MSRFKAIELDAVSRQRTGREHLLEADTRQAALAELLERLGIPLDQAHIDPTRTLIRTSSELWTLVGSSPPAEAADTSPSLRRAGAKHKRVR